MSVANQGMLLAFIIIVLGFVGVWAALAGMGAVFHIIREALEPRTRKEWNYGRRSRT